MIAIKFSQAYDITPDPAPSGLCQCGFRFTEWAALRTHWETCPLVPKVRTLTLCYDTRRADTRVWAVRDGRTWHMASHVSIQMPMRTVYKGRSNRQPRAYLTGRGRLTWMGTTAVLTP